jgi:hypothetical protein
MAQECVVSCNCVLCPNYPYECNLIGRPDLREALCQGLIKFAASDPAVLLVLLVLW